MLPVVLIRPLLISLTELAPPTWKKNHADKVSPAINPLTVLIAFMLFDQFIKIFRGESGLIVG